MKEKNMRGYLSFFKMMRKLMGEGTVEAMLLRYEYGMTEEDEDKRDLCGIATRGLTGQDMPFDQQLSWYFWYSLAMLTPILHRDVQDHPEEYEPQAAAHVLVLEQLRARLDAWRYGYLDFEGVKRCVSDDRTRQSRVPICGANKEFAKGELGEPERQRAALDFAIRVFEVWLENWDQT